MTFEELKKEAEQQGYYLMKKNTYVKFERCLCGHNSHLTGYEPRTGRVCYICSYCHKYGPYAKNRKDAKVLWNEMIQREREASHENR